MNLRFQVVVSRRQEQQASLPLPPPPPQQPAPPTEGSSQGPYQNGVNGHHQQQYASQQSNRSNHHQQHQPMSQPPSQYQQPPSQQQRSWGSQAPVRHPGHKAAGGRGRPVYSAPYTEPYYAAQYGGQQRPPTQQQSWQAGPSGQHSRPLQYPGHAQAAAQSARPALRSTQSHQQGEHAMPDRTDPRRHLTAYQNRTGSADASGGHALGQNDWMPKQEHNSTFRQHPQGQSAPTQQQRGWHSQQQR